MPVRRDPPQTHMLRAFEAVARLKSFRQAAVEIGVTQSAVSQRVAALESRLGACLIHREHGRFELTRDGLAYLATVQSVLRTLEQAEDRLTDRRVVVRMTVVPSFARCWLVPRLGSLSSSFENICLDLHVSDEIVSLDDGEFDLAIRLHANEGNLGERMTVTDDVLIPVYMPGDREKHVECSSDPFEGITLLEDDCSRLGGSRNQSWAFWYARNEYDLPQGRRRIVFSDAGLMVEAARSGVGVALARRSLVADHLAAGDLIEREGTPLESLGQTWLMQRRAGNRSIASQRVVKWLLDAVSADHA